MMTMRELRVGERVSIRDGKVQYWLTHQGDVFECTCPSWCNQTVEPERRTCDHLRSYVGDYRESVRTATLDPLRMPVRPYGIPEKGTTREDRSVSDRRRAALRRTVESFPVVYDKMLLVYGLRMPKHLAYAIGWWHGLSSREQRMTMQYFGSGAYGVSEWFTVKNLVRPVLPGLDERLHCRRRRDPPEMVPIFAGSSDGYWGLWYDEPTELPRTIVRDYRNDSEFTAYGPTLLSFLRESFIEDVHFDDHRLLAILDWLDEVLAQELEAHRSEAIPLPETEHQDILGGPAPMISGWNLPDDFAEEASYTRKNAYREKAPVVDEWIAKARAELARGEPGRALVLGRELHWADVAEWHQACTELLVGAYEALDRASFAEIARVHHLHRDRSGAEVYVAPPPTAFESALERSDYALVATLLRKATGESPISDALHTCDLGMIDMLLENPAFRATIETAQLFHLDRIAELDRPNGAAHHAAVLYLFDRCGLGGDVLESVLRLPSDRELLTRALAKVDLTWRSGSGRSVLHVAARNSSVLGVCALLARGCDPCLTDAFGETPYDVIGDDIDVNVDDSDQRTAIVEILCAHGGEPERADHVDR